MAMNQLSISVRVRGVRGAVALAWALDLLPWLSDRVRVRIMNAYLRRFARMRVGTGRWEPIGIRAVVEREDA